MEALHPREAVHIPDATVTPLALDPSVASLAALPFIAATQEVNDHPKSIGCGYFSTTRHAPAGCSFAWSFSM
jgi:hypothetical protein